MIKLEYWSVGVLEYWDKNKLEQWIMGVLEKLFKTSIPILQYSISLSPSR
jgi:hypothetical protein